MSTPASQLPFLPQTLPKTQQDWQQALNVLQTWAQAIQAPFPQTSAEVAASVTPINYGKFPSPWKDISRFVTDNTGVTDVSAQFADAIAAESNIIIPDGIYRFASQVNVNKSNLTIEGSGRANISSFGRSGKGAVIVLDAAAGAGAAALAWGNAPYLAIDASGFGIELPNTGLAQIGIRLGQVLHSNIGSLWIQGGGTVNDDTIAIQFDGLLPAGGFGYSGGTNVRDCLLANNLTGVNILGVTDTISIRDCNFYGSGGHLTNVGVFLANTAFGCAVSGSTFSQMSVGINTLGRGMRQVANYFENGPLPSSLAWQWARGAGNTNITNFSLGDWRNNLTYAAPINGTDGCVVIGQNNTVFDNSSIEIGVTTPVLVSSVSLANASGSSAGTLTNAPSPGNPTKWIQINDNGVLRNIPAW